MHSRYRFWCGVCNLAACIYRCCCSCGRHAFREVLHVCARSSQNCRKMAAAVAVDSVLVLGASVLSYANSLDGGFVFDDHRGILSNDDLNPAKTELQELFYHDFWGGHMNREQSHKSYRPLTVLTFRYMNYAIHELDPFGYHVVNVLCHSLASLLFLWLCRACFREDRGRWPLLAALLFALHSVHTEVVRSD